MKNGAMIGSKFLNFGILNLEALPERFSRYDQIPSLDRVVLGNLKSKVSKNPKNFSISSSNLAEISFENYSKIYLCFDKGNN